MTPDRLRPLLPWALLALLVAGSVYGYTEIRASEEAAKERARNATERADRMAARNDSLDAAYQELARQYSRFAAQATARRDSLRSAVRALRREAEDEGASAQARTDSLQATLESIVVVAAEPEAKSYARYALTQLDSIRADHRAQVRALEEALATKDSINVSLREQLARAEEKARRCREGWEQCRLSLDSTKTALEKWRSVADPGFFESLAKCLPETAVKGGVVAGAYLVEPKAGIGAGALLALGLALGGPC